MLSDDKTKINTENAAGREDGSPQLRPVPNFAFSLDDKLEEVDGLPVLRHGDDSDWKPVIKVTDTEEAAQDAERSQTEYRKNSETREEENSADDEEEDTAEFDAEYREGIDEFSSFETRYDGGGEQTEERYTDPEEHGLCETDSDAGGDSEAEGGNAEAGETGGGSEEGTGNGAGEAGREPEACGEAGTGGSEETEAPEESVDGTPESVIITEETAGDGDAEETAGGGDAEETAADEDGGEDAAEMPADPDGDEYEDDGNEGEEAFGPETDGEPDDFQAFDSGESDVAVTDAAGLDWRRKQLRYKTQKEGRRLIELGWATAAVTELIKRPEETQEEAPDEEAERRLEEAYLKASADEAARIAAEKEAAMREAAEREAELAALAEQEAEEKRRHEREGKVLAEDDPMREEYLGSLIGKGDIWGPEELDADNGGTGEGAETAFDGGHPEDAEPIDYDDIFQDDPIRTRRKKIGKKVTGIFWKIIRNILLFAVIFTVAFMMVAAFNVYVRRSNEVVGSSMEPTLNDGDRVYTSLLPYLSGEPQRGDIVVIDITRKDSGFGFFARIGDVLRSIEAVDKVFFKNQTPDTYWIKRIVAVGGDTLEFKNGQVYLNGELLEEDYIKEFPVNNYPEGETVTVPEGYIYVMGDNRNVSQDSRVVGALPEEIIVGKKVR